eukprot:1158855-Pelagomonas_calceolata.AAC.14
MWCKGRLAVQYTVSRCFLVAAGGGWLPDEAGWLFNYVASAFLAFVWQDLLCLLCFWCATEAGWLHHLHTCHAQDAWALAVKLDREFGYSGMPTTLLSPQPADSSRGLVRIMACSKPAVYSPLSVRRDLSTSSLGVWWALERSDLLHLQVRFLRA